VAKELHDELEKIYIQAMDFTKIEEITKKIHEEIKSLIVH